MLLFISMWAVCLSVCLYQNVSSSSDVPPTDSLAVTAQNTLGRSRLYPVGVNVILVHAMTARGGRGEL